MPDAGIRIRNVTSGGWPTELFADGLDGVERETFLAVVYLDCQSLGLSAGEEEREESASRVGRVREVGDYIGDDEAGSEDLEFELGGEGGPAPSAWLLRLV